MAKKKTAGKKRRGKTFSRILFLILIVFLFVGFLALRERIRAVEPTPVYTLSQEEEEKLQIILHRGDLYPEDLQDIARVYPETVDFVYRYPEDAWEEAAFYKTWEKGEIPHFLQWDKVWGYKEYCGSFLAVTGCGPTALAMVYNGLQNEAAMTPYEIGLLAEEMGYAEPGEGTHQGFLLNGGEALGLRVYTPEWTKRAWERELKKGHPLIINVGPGDFTSGGHYIVVDKYSLRGFHVLDPNSRIHQEKLWKFEELLPQTRGVWSYSM